MHLIPSPSRPCSSIHPASLTLSPPIVACSPPTVTIRLHPIGSAPHLTKRVFKLSANQRFETIVVFIRKRLQVPAHESVFCYVGNVFAPSLDEGVGNLWTVSTYLLFFDEDNGLCEWQDRVFGTEDAPVHRLG